jgi:hypothetical protein
MEHEIVTTWHNDYCPIATGEEIGDAYCACPYIEDQIKRLARLVLNLCECDSSFPEMKCVIDLAADIISDELMLVEHLTEIITPTTD